MLIVDADDGYDTDRIPILPSNGNNELKPRTYKQTVATSINFQQDKTLSVLRNNKHILKSSQNLSLPDTGSAKSIPLGEIPCSFSLCTANRGVIQNERRAFRKITQRKMKLYLYQPRKRMCRWRLTSAQTLESVNIARITLWHALVLKACLVLRARKLRRYAKLHVSY